MADVLVIGVGNEYRGDDGVGIVMARRIAERRIPGVVVREATGEGAGLINAWDGHQTVFLFDAVKSHSTPGTTHRLDASEAPIPSGLFHYSTHEFGLAEAVEMSRAMDLLPGRLVIYGVEGEHFDGGRKLSPSVQNGMSVLLIEAVDEIEASMRATKPSV